MTRTLVATATVLLGAMTLLTPAAEACISCEYTPSVAHSPSPSHGATHYRVKRVYGRATERSARAAKKRIVKRKTAAKKAQTAATAPAETPAVKTKAQAETENSSIATATLQTNETVDAKEAPAAATKANKNVGCKKFFPSVGMTLTVPCE